MSHLVDDSDEDYPSPAPQGRRGSVLDDGIMREMLAVRQRRMSMSSPLKPPGASSPASSSPLASRKNTGTLTRSPCNPTTDTTTTGPAPLVKRKTSPLSSGGTMSVAEFFATADESQKNEVAAAADRVGKEVESERGGVKGGDEWMKGNGTPYPDRSLLGNVEDEEGMGGEILDPEQEMERMERMYVMLRWSKKYRKMQVSSANASWGQHDGTPSALSSAVDDDPDGQDIDITDELAASASLDNPLALTPSEETLAESITQKTTKPSSRKTELIPDDQSTSRTSRSKKPKQRNNRPLRVRFDDTVVILDVSRTDDTDNDTDSSIPSSDTPSSSSETLDQDDGEDVDTPNEEPDVIKPNKMRRRSSTIAALATKQKVPATVLKKALRAMQKALGATRVKVERVDTGAD
ncbi:hypothetical protein HDV00_008072 [Rhizophlyctis rosea]|nr:hypothetical protein HDV00_008072 [Rhizophlyctis rosea]